MGVVSRIQIFIYAHRQSFPKSKMIHLKLQEQISSFCVCIQLTFIQKMTLSDHTIQTWYG